MLAYDIGEKQIPAGNESQELSNSHIAVQVSRACFGNAGSKLCIAQAGKYGCQRRYQERNDDAGSSGVPGHLSGEDVHSSPQGAAHSQGHQVQSGQASVKGGLLPIGFNGLPPRKAHQKGLHPRHASGVVGWRAEEKWYKKRQVGGQVDVVEAKRVSGRSSEGREEEYGRKGTSVNVSVNNCQISQEEEHLLLKNKHLSTFHFIPTKTQIFK